jgi:hypothetical protein
MPELGHDMAQLGSLLHLSNLNRDLRMEGRIGKTSEAS